MELTFTRINHMHYKVWVLTLHRIFPSEKFGNDRSHNRRHPEECRLSWRSSHSLETRVFTAGSYSPGSRGSALPSLEKNDWIRFGMQNGKSLNGRDLFHAERYVHPLRAALFRGLTSSSSDVSPVWSLRTLLARWFTTRSGVFALRGQRCSANYLVVRMDFILSSVHDALRQFEKWTKFEVCEHFLPIGDFVNESQIGETSLLVIQTTVLFSCT